MSISNEIQLSDIELATQEVVDRQLEAYNNRDIEAFAATYHDDVEIHEFPGGLRFKGKETLITTYGPKFASLKRLQAVSLTRIVNNNILVDHELAESSSEDPKVVDRSIRVIASYEVIDGLIKRVVFM